MTFPEIGSQESQFHINFLLKLEVVVKLFEQVSVCTVVCQRRFRRGEGVGQTDGRTDGERKVVSINSQNVL